jgi:hypothetical protein
MMESTDQTIPLILPIHPITLDVDGKTIHRGFKQTIADVIHGPHLQEAMQIGFDSQDATNSHDSTILRSTKVGQFCGLGMDAAA